VQVWAVCNGGVIKKRDLLKLCLNKWPFMSWFARVHGGDDIEFTAESIGRRSLLVLGMETPAVVRVRQGRIVVEEA